VKLLRVVAADTTKPFALFAGAIEMACLLLKMACLLLKMACLLLKVAC